ncbi:MAG: hypothetical protein HYW52_07720 [Gemmatimonadetes bacterium]|nr:hypothetical protein [Gemmatimonadota bacterium]
MDANAIAMLIPIAGMGLGALFLVGAYKLVGRWLDRGRGGAASGLAEEVARLREEVEALSEVNRRVLELEERVDFAERVLAQAQHNRLNAGGETGR